MAYQTANELLKKQRIVEDLIHNQTMKQHSLVETVVKNQHQAELKAFIDRVSPEEIVSILQLLSEDHAAYLWPSISSEKMNDVLLEMPDSLRLQIGIRDQPTITAGRIRAFEINDGKIRSVSVSTDRDLGSVKPLWVDMLGASKAERSFIGRYFGLDLPDPNELTDLEISSRFYEEDKDEIHLNSNFLLNIGDRPTSVPVACIIHANVLFTVRNVDLPVFRLQRFRVRQEADQINDCKDILLDLYNEDVEYSADALEDIYAKLRQVGQQVLQDAMPDEEASRNLADIAEGEELNGLIRGNLLDTQRAVSFVLRGRFLTPAQSDEAKEILRDIESLNTHTSFLFDKINFLMDATVGFINVNQNQRITQLTVINIVFMPLNLIAGIGGMSEFSMMTKELGVDWPIAYSSFSVSMVVLGVATYLILKRAKSKRGRRRSSAPFAKHPKTLVPHRRHPGP